MSRRVFIFFSLRLLQIMSIWMHTPMKIPQKKRIQLHVQAASPDKLPENRSLRDHITVDGKEIVQEFEKPLRLIILFPVSRDIEEQRFRIELQYRKLIHKRGVEHHVCTLLEREDIFILTAAYRRPALDGL